MGYLEMLQRMPKATRQFVDPIGWYKNAKSIGCFRHYDFGVAHDDAPIGGIEALIQSCQLAVFFLESRSEVVWDLIRKYKDKCLILSLNTTVRSILSKDVTLQDEYCENLGAFFSKMVPKIAALLQVTLDDIEQMINARVDELKRSLNAHQDHEAADFRACRPNDYTFLQLLAPYGREVLEDQAVEHSKRAQAILDSAKRVLNAHTFIASGEDEGNIRRADYIPPIVLSWPYYGPTHKALFEDMLQMKGGELRDQFRAIKEIVFTEQDPNTYDFTMPGELAAYPGAMTAAVTEFQIKMTVYMDSISYLHGSFQDSPILRMPITGRSVNEALSSFQQSHLGLNSSSKRISHRLKRCGEILESRFPEKFLSHIDKYYDQMVAITDIPIEWTVCDGVPLGFMLDVCRLPQTNPSSIMAQFASNSALGYSVKSNILEKTLVICGANSSDAIGKVFDTFKEELSAANLAGPIAIRCLSKSEFVGAVETHKPDLLIIDSHGNFTPNESSYLNIGNERITGEDIVKIKHTVPLVVLSCCLTAPLYGCPNPIAQAFFEVGSRSVVSTFLPISVDRGHLLYRRILGNLAVAVKQGYHRNWLSYISHNLRTSHIDDYLVPLQQTLGIVNRERLIEYKVPWMINCMHPGKRRNAYLATREAAVNCFSPDLHRRAHAILNGQHLISEAFYYTHLGRADLVQFDVMLEDRVSANPEAKDLYNEISARGCL